MRSVTPRTRGRHRSGATVLDLVGLVTVAAPLAIGAVHVEAQLALAAVVALAMVSVWLRPAAMLPTLQVIGLTALVWFALSLLALIPMPAEVVATFSEQAAETYATATSLTGSPYRPSLSPDRARSATMLLTLLIYGLLAATVWGRAREATPRDSALTRVPLYVIFAGALTGLVAMTHTAMSATSLYGLYSPTAPLGSQPLRGPMVNSNHTAALLLLASCVTFGVWLKMRERKRAMLLAGVWALAVAGVVISASRANIALLVVAHGYLLWRVRREDSEPGRVGWAAAGVAALAGTMALGLGEQWWQNIRGSSVESGVFASALIDRWSTGWHVLLERPWLGHGPGAFGVASPRHTTSWLNGYMEYAHNLPLQLTTEWGVPVGLSLLAVGGWWLVRLLRDTYRRPSDHAAAVGLTAVVCQNMVDFSLLVPGVGVVWVVTAAWLSGTARPKKDLSVGPLSASRVLVTLSCVSMLGPLGLLSYDGDLTRMDTSLRAAAPSETWRNAVHQAIGEHPADFHVHILGSAIARANGDTNLAHQLGQRAVSLAPLSRVVLEEAARAAFAADEHDAGRDALDKLCRRPPIHSQKCLTLLVAERGRRGLIAEVIETDPGLTLALAEHLRQRGHRKAVTEVLTWARGEFPDHLGVQEALVAAWLRTPDGAEALDTLSVDILARSADEADEDTKRRMQRLGYLVQGRLVEREGRHLEARHLYQEAAKLDPSRATAPLFMAARVLMRVDDLDRLDKILDQLYRSLPPRDTMSRVSYHRLRSKAHLRAGHLREGVVELHKAIRLRPRDHTLYESLASALTALGDERGARRAQEQATQYR